MSTAKEQIAFLQTCRKSCLMCSAPELPMIDELMQIVKDYGEDPDPIPLQLLDHMSGQPVWIESERINEWRIVHSVHSHDVVGHGVIFVRRTGEKRHEPDSDYGVTWLPYARQRGKQR